MILKYKGYITIYKGLRAFYTYVNQFYIHGSVHRNSILIRSNKMQNYAGVYLLQNHPLHVSDAHRTHHREYIKL